MLHTSDYKELKLLKRGKVRDVYDLGDKILFIATDRISCFDFVLPTPIPDKGKVLNQMALFWFKLLTGTVENHIISSSIKDLPPSLQSKKELEGRFVIVKKCEVIPFECIVRGYISGSGWKEYKKSQSICGIKLPAGLKESDKLPQTVFTPTTKAEAGHDENVDFEFMVSQIGQEKAETLKRLSIAVYKKAADYALTKGIIIADTKFEFGLLDGRIILIDEVLTPDSSRFWPKDTYKPGGPQFSYDKQFVRDYLESINWNKQPPVPQLPEDIVKKTQAKYKEALKILAGI